MKSDLNLISLLSINIIALVFLFTFPVYEQKTDQIETKKEGPEEILNHSTNSANFSKKEQKPLLTILKEIFVSKYFHHENIWATVFWVGEEASEENDFIANDVSYWDRNWQSSFGGVDEPDERNGYFPAAFKPKQNPFYFALPYGEFEKGRNLKQNAVNIPWYLESLQTKASLVKNRWIKVGFRNKICFAQWEDVGPGKTNDFDYVFGKNPPENQFTGIDLSPAVRDCLGMGGKNKVDWQFVDFSEVPLGPWKEIITSD